MKRESVCYISEKYLYRMTVVSFKLHQFHEFVVADVPIPIEVCLLQQLINIFLCHLLAKLL
jgi:hypothetical protein